MAYINGTGLSHLISKMKAAFWAKSDVVNISIDNAPTANSDNLVKSGGVKSYVDGAIPTVPTISTNIQTDKASDVKTVSPKAVYDEMHTAVASSQPQGGFLPNVVYDLGVLTGTVTFALATPSDANIPNAYHWTFDTGSTEPTINWPSGVIFPDGVTPTVEASKHYEVLVRNGYGSILIYSLT